MKWIRITALITCINLAGSLHIMAQPITGSKLQNEEDSHVWQVADSFCVIFNSGDTAAMNQLLAPDFMLQWMHENFLGKKGLFKAMIDTAVHTTLKHRIKRDGQVMIRYSDDKTASSLDATIEFLDKTVTDAVKKEQTLGQCIMYFQKRNGRWHLKTVHLDIHHSRG